LAFEKFQNKIRHNVRKFNSIPGCKAQEMELVKHQDSLSTPPVATIYDEGSS